MSSEGRLGPRIVRNKKRDTSRGMDIPKLDETILNEAHTEIIKMLEGLTDDKGRVKVNEEILRKIQKILNKYGIKDVADLHLETVLNPQFVQIIDKMMKKMQSENKKKFKLTKLHKALLATIISHIVLVLLGTGVYELYQKRKDVACRKVFRETGEIPGNMTFKQFISECDEITKRKLNKESDVDPPDDSKFFYVPEHLLKEDK